MKIIIILISIYIIVVQANSESCQDSRELESNCGNYCFKVIRPLLDHTKELQSQITHFINKKRLEESERLIEQNIEKKLEDLRIFMDLKKSNVGKPYQKIGQKYYYIEQTEKWNWFGAVHKCISLGGHLVSIKNQSEFNAIRDNLLPNRNYWIDINDLTAEGILLSVATGLKPTYFNWHGDNPDNVKGIEHCVELWYHNERHLMNDAPCHEGKYFICEPENQ